LVTAVDHHGSDDVVRALGGAASPRDLARLRQQRAIFGLRFARRGFVYPAFQFEPELGRVNPTVASVNRLALRTCSTAMVARWWLDTSVSQIDVLSLLMDGRHDVIAAHARSFVAEVTRGDDTGSHAGQGCRGPVQRQGDRHV
jgi:hypothetical protein